jgi:hypothetical protein
MPHPRGKKPFAEKGVMHVFKYLGVIISIKVGEIFSRTRF